MACRPAPQLRPQDSRQMSACRDATAEPCAYMPINRFVRHRIKGRAEMCGAGAALQALTPPISALRSA